MNIVGMSTRFLQKLSVVFGVQMDPVLTIEPAHDSHLALLTDEIKGTPVLKV